MKWNFIHSWHLFHFYFIPCGTYFISFHSLWHLFHFISFLAALILFHFIPCSTYFILFHFILFLAAFISFLVAFISFLVAHISFIHGTYFISISFLAAFISFYFILCGTYFILFYCFNPSKVTIQCYICFRCTIEWSNNSIHCSVLMW